MTAEFARQQWLLSTQIQALSRPCSNPDKLQNADNQTHTDVVLTHATVPHAHIMVWVMVLIINCSVVPWQYGPVQRGWQPDRHRPVSWSHRSEASAQWHSRPQLMPKRPDGQSNAQKKQLSNELNNFQLETCSNIISQLPQHSLFKLFSTYQRPYLQKFLSKT